MSLMLDEHRLYLSDRTRISLFRRAAEAVVKRGDVVLDLGCGTGVLGMLAMKAGAARVYQVDATPMLQVAREVARANGFGEKAIGIRGLSSRAMLPEKVDVVIADQLSFLGIGAGVPEVFNDVRRRLLKPGGRTIPRRVEILVAAANFPEMWNVANFWSKNRAGLKMSPAQRMALNNWYPCETRPARIFGEPVRMFTFDLTDMTPEHFHAEAEIQITTAGVMHGLSGWFAAELAPGIVMTNSPFDKGRIGRPAAFLPLERSVALRKGDRLKITMGLMPTQTMLTWKVTVLNSRGIEKARCIQSTLKGMVLLTEDLAKTRPDFVPRLSAWGEARRSVDNLIDGKRSVAEIEKELFRAHPNLFSSLADTSAYVAGILARYALAESN